MTFCRVKRRFCKIIDMILYMSIFPLINDKFLVGRGDQVSFHSHLGHMVGPQTVICSWFCISGTFYLCKYVCKYLFCIVVYLVYNVVFLSDVQESDSVIHISILFQILFPCILLLNIPCVNSRTSLAIYFIYSSMYILLFFKIFCSLDESCDTGQEVGKWAEVKWVIGGSYTSINYVYNIQIRYFDNKSLLRVLSLLFVFGVFYYLFRSH